MKQSMPEISTAKLSDSAREYAQRITVKGHLRASKPPVPKVKVPSQKYGWTWEPQQAIDGCAAYVWRMVAFQISPIAKHHCMPCTADFDLPGEFDSRRLLAEELDLIVAEIVAAVPIHQWHGVIRWGQVFGQVGSPVVQEDGAIVYR